MIKIRVVKTASKSNAVQVIEYKNYSRKVLKHIGSGKSEAELSILLNQANEWVKNYIGQLALFDSAKSDNILHLDHYEFLGVHYRFLHETISTIQTQLGFTELLHPLLNDLVAMRILEPASKLRSIDLIRQYFGLNHNRKNYYKQALQWLDLKQKVEDKITAFAKQAYSFNYDLVFYDVTTLYFETFDEDELRKNGFSKEKKSDQPQILVALMVSKEGFPVGYQIFEGNTFEGHTFIPAVQSFIKSNNVENLVVIADAAMISDNNVEALKQKGIHYIVGARLGNVNATLLAEIDTKLTREDEQIIRLQTDKGYLICSFSKLRFRKDKYEMEKQIQRAQNLIVTPSKSKKTKFARSKGEQYELNQKLIDKTTKLLGIKGYYTDLKEEDCNSKTVIERYHQLYKIEQAFRITKSDLATRPIFHYKQQPIQLHMLICFMALSIAKHIELQTNVSIRKFVDESKKISDARMLNKITQKEVNVRVKITEKMSEYLKLLKITH
jgi:transposase